MSSLITFGFAPGGGSLITFGFGSAVAPVSDNGQVTSIKFREDFPEFGDVDLFPKSQINFYLTLGYKLLNACRWHDILSEGIELFVAHNIVLERQAQAAANNGGVPGTAVGIVSAKKVDKVSVNYDTTSSMEENAGHWNMTIYGQRFIRLARMMGMGPIQVGTPGPAPVGSIGGAWAGPPIGPGWLGS